MNEPDRPGRASATGLLSPQDQPARVARIHLNAWKETASEQGQECLPVVAASERRGDLDGVRGRRGNHGGDAGENGGIDPDAPRVATIGLSHRVSVLDGHPRASHLRGRRNEGRDQRSSESDANYNSCGGFLHRRGWRPTDWEALLSL